MMRRYVWKKRDGYSQPIGLTKLMGMAALKVIAGMGPFALIQDGEPVALNMSRRSVLDRFKQAIEHREIGSTFRIRKGNGAVVFTARAIRIDDVIPTTNSTSGNTNADRFYNWVMSRYRAYSPRYAGAYVCKTVVGTSSLSQHAFGNAVDFFFDTLTNQDAVALAAVRAADELSISLLISRDRDWSPSGGWTPYGGDYHSHLHVQFRPEFSGTCGVREP